MPPTEGRPPKACHARTGISRQKNTKRKSIPLAPALARGPIVVLFDQYLVLRHELFAAVSVHFGAHGYGQVAPDVLEDVGDLVGLALRPAVAGAGIVACLLLGVVLLLIALLGL